MAVAPKDTSEQLIMDSDQLATELGLSPEQSQILGLKTDTVIAAGAGAGKTTALVGAVLNDLLVEKVAPQRLCVCTFTRAAAAELLVRLQVGLDQLLGADADSIDLQQCWIGTIDSISSRFLQGVSTGPVQIFDPHQLRRLRAQALKKTLDELDDADLYILDHILDPDNGELEQLLLKSYDTVLSSPSGLQLHIPPTQPFDLQACEDAFAALLAEPKLSDKAGEAVADDLARIQAGEIEGLATNSYGIRAAALVPARDAAIASREAYREAISDEKTKAARVAFIAAYEAFMGNYQQQLDDAEAMDFSALNAAALQLSHQQGNIFERTYVDEAQDTSPLQQELLRALSSGPAIHIGDANQSIYGFRGADVDNFRRGVAGAERIELADNYRSRSDVLEVINTLCAQLPDLKQDLVWMRSGREDTAEDTGLVSAEMLLTLNKSRPMKAAGEAELAVPHILASAAARGLSYNDVCVLVRSNDEVGIYAQEFRRHGVAALAIQGRGLLIQEECRDVIAYLRLLADERDEEALLRVLSSPFCGLGDHRLHEICGSRATDVQALKARNAHVDNTDEDWPHLSEIIAVEEPGFWERFQEVRKQRIGARATDLLRHGIEAHGYDLALQLLDETGYRWRNVEKLLWFIADLEAEEGPGLHTLTERLEIEAEADEEKPDERLPAEIDAVRVMTVHQAKGLQFKLVAVARLSKQIRAKPGKVWIAGDQRDADASLSAGALGMSLPGVKDNVAARLIDAQKTADQAEASRLLYVALTRAEDHLIMIGSAAQTTEQQMKLEPPFSLLADHLQADETPDDGEPHLQDLGQTKISIQILQPEEDRRQAEKQEQIRQEQVDTDAIADDPILAPARLPSVAPEPLSYTKIAAWRRCSLRRQLEHDLRLSAPIEGDPLNDETTWDGEDAEAEELPRLAEKLILSRSAGNHKLLGIRLHRLLADIDWHQQASVDAAIAEAEEWQEKSASPADLLRTAAALAVEHQIPTAEKIYAERRFSVLLGDQLLTGAIDLIAYHPRHALIIDWKTGSDSEQIFGEDYDLQRRLYAAAVLSEPDAPDQVISLTLHLPDGGCEQQQWSKEQLPQLLDELRLQVDEILTAAPFPAAETEQPFCEGCPGLSKICPVSRTRQAA